MLWPVDRNLFVYLTLVDSLSKGIRCGNENLAKTWGGDHPTLRDLQINSGGTLYKKIARYQLHWHQADKLL